MDRESIRINWNRNKRYTPAETKVAEWINEDAGIGASIESGNHKWANNWADFIDEAKISSIQRASWVLRWRGCDILKTSSQTVTSALLVSRVIQIINNNKQTSLILLKFKNLWVKMKSALLILSLKKE
jgi:Na+-translocating ferredoxin:NAD+ oxidoreductase RnfG subunit